MKVCLVRPPTLTTADSFGEDSAAPLGVAYLAACLRVAKHDVSIVDALGEALSQYTPISIVPKGLRHGLEDEETVSRIPADVDIIGVSTMFSQGWPLDRSVILKIREKFPDIPIVVGGEHATALPEYTMNDCPAIDYIVLGEGEQTLVDLVEIIEQNGDPKDTNGLFYREGDAFVKTVARNRIREIDVMPRPAWDLLPIDSYLDGNVTFGVNLGRSMPMLASRGCPFQCTFCSNPVMYGNLWRPRSPQEVFDEMSDYIQHYNVYNFDFYDLTAIVKRSWIIEFCQIIIDSGQKITWQLPSGTRSEALDEESTELLYRAGCRYLVYAPESGSPEILTLIKKKISLPKMLSSIKASYSNGIGTKANIIFGFPGEKPGHILQSYGFIAKLAFVGTWDTTCFAFSPYPGSELFESLLNKKVIKLDEDYFRGLSQYTDPSKSVSYSENISALQLRLYCLFGIILFYSLSYLFRPIRFFNLIKNVYLNDPKNKIEAALVRVMKKRRIMSAES